MKKLPNTGLFNFIPEVTLEKSHTFGEGLLFNYNTVKNSINSYFIDTTGEFNDMFEGITFSKLYSAFSYLVITGKIKTLFSEEPKSAEELKDFLISNTVIEGDKYYLNPELLSDEEGVIIVDEMIKRVGEYHTVLFSLDFDELSSFNDTNILHLYKTMNALVTMMMERSVVNRRKKS